MRVRLNLATAPLQNHRRLLLGAGGLGTAALALLVVLSVHNYSVFRENREIRSEVTRLESEMRDLREERKELAKFFKQPDTRQVMDRAALLNGLIEQRSFPWTRIFMDLERLLPEGVRVVSISPRMREGRVEVRLIVGAAGDEGKLRFLRTLDASREFTDIQLLGESRPNRPGQDRVLLDLTAWYTPE